MDSLFSHIANRNCPGAGPGRGVGGRPGRRGENCIPQGNVLVIQESDKPAPDDNRKGGVICFEATSGSLDVLFIGLMGIPGPGYFVEVLLESAASPVRIPIDGFGTNSVQRIPINLDGVKSLCVFFPGEGAVTDLGICEGSHAPSVSGMPSTSPSSRPSGSVNPSSQPSALPSLSALPSRAPSSIPSFSPTKAGATRSPTTLPSSSPSNLPSGSVSPSDAPSGVPSVSTVPSGVPSVPPSYSPTKSDSTRSPTTVPSSSPSDLPTGSVSPSAVPSGVPSISSVPSASPSVSPSYSPTEAGATRTPTSLPSAVPSNLPSGSTSPSVSPTGVPSLSAGPSRSPSLSPVASPPVAVATSIPSAAPSESCSDVVVVDFEASGNGTRLSRGDYVGDDWSERYGFVVDALATCGGFTPGSKARIFDTANPGSSQLDGDPDLGSPNRYVVVWIGLH